MTTMLTARSAKELEHFERIRQTFESVDQQKKDGSTGAPQTIAEAMEAFSLGASPSEEMPITNGEHPPTSTGSIPDRKGQKPWPGSIVHNPRGHARISSKGKGKSVAGRKGKWSKLGSDLARKYGAKDGDDDEDDDMADGVVDGEDDEDDYVVRTDHLVNPMERVE